MKNRQKTSHHICAPSEHSYQYDHNLHSRINQDLHFLHAGNEDSDQTARMCTLTVVLNGRTCPKERFLTVRHKYLSTASVMLINDADNR